MFVQRIVTLGGRVNSIILANRVPRLPPAATCAASHHITSNQHHFHIQHGNMSKNGEGNFKPVPKAQSQDLPG